MTTLTWTSDNITPYHQLSLFDFVYDPPAEGTILCRHCSKVKPREMFRLYRRATGAYDCRSTSCKSCQSDSKALVRDLRKTAPDMPPDCECCGKPFDKLVLDHDYETKTFRGWLCSPCNMSIGLLGDNLAGLHRAVDYLVQS
jgi:hypothetical protein